jgi:hypothetical protein
MRRVNARQSVAVVISGHIKKYNFIISYKKIKVKGLQGRIRQEIKLIVTNTVKLGYNVIKGT